MNKRLLLALSLTLFILVGCGSTGTKAPVTSGAGLVEESYSKEDLTIALRDMRTARADEKYKQQLKAAYIALELDLLDQARQLTDPLAQAHLDNAENIEFLIITGGILVKSDQVASGLAWLNAVDADLINLYPRLLIRWGKYRALAHMKQGDYITSARERIYYDGLLDLSSRKQNHEAILQTLNVETTRNLAEAASGSKNSEFKGWLLLASTMKLMALNPFTQLEALNRWRQDWPKHPASLDPPESLRILEDIVTNQPMHIAVMLPLSGSLASVGGAIRDGLLAAHFKYGLENPNRPFISFIDTADISMEIAYEIAVAKQADFIIGPLQQEKIKELLTHLTPGIPVLALNQIDLRRPAENLYQFSLAPEDEIEQIVKQASMRGYRHTLAVMPNSPWGQKNLDLFKSKWTQDDRVLVDTAYYQPTGDYNGFIKDILGVNKSEQRSARIRRLLGTRLEFIPRRRRDLDFIFLVGNADQAASLKPALSFYYAENVPVFATSTIHDNSQKRLSHMDLNNIEFCEMPFKLDIDDPLHREITGNWQASQGNLAPFYAMGIDAYHIYPRLKQMQQVSGFKLSGATGLLSLNDRNVVTRQLMWAQFYEGNVRHLPILISIHDQR